MTIKEKLMGAWDTVKEAVKDSKNVKTTTYPFETETYQDYTTKPQEKK